MSSSKRLAYANALRGRLLRSPSGLCAEAELGEFEAVAAYQADDGSREFAFCLEGLLIDPDGEARFIPYAEISATDYRDVQKLRMEKQAQVYRSITLSLCNGETIDLPLTETPGRGSERLAIGRLIEQRVGLAKLPKMGG